MSSSGRASQRGDGGFTLVEMLVVLVILPLVVGAIVEVILTAVRNDEVVSGRLSDTQASQVLASYFYRDVQSSLYVTTSPGQACGTPGLELRGHPLGTALLSLALAGATNPYVVTYWLDPNGEPDGSGSVVRVSCALNSLSEPPEANDGSGYAPPAGNPVAAVIGGPASPAFAYVTVNAARSSEGWVPSDSGLTVALDTGHGSGGVEQSPGLQIDLVAEPRA